MKDILRFSTLAVLLLCVGIVGNPAYAEHDGVEPNCILHEQPVYYKPYRSDKHDHNGKLISPLNRDTLNGLGDENLELLDIVVEEKSYFYWFFCDKEKKFEYQVLKFPGMSRLHDLARAGWKIASVVAVYGTKQDRPWEDYYYLVKPKQ